MSDSREMNDPTWKDIPVFSFGAILECTVKEVTGSRIIAERDSVDIWILISEVVWIPERIKLKELYNLGDVIKVMILRFAPEEKHYIGSIRRVSVTNPLEAYAERGIGATYLAKVSNHEPSLGPLFCRVMLDNGIQGVCMIEKDREVAIGDQINVYAIEVDPHDFYITFAVA